MRDQKIKLPTHIIFHEQHIYKERYQNSLKNQSTGRTTILDIN